MITHGSLQKALTNYDTLNSEVESTMVNSHIKPKSSKHLNKNIYIYIYIYEKSLKPTLNKQLLKSFPKETPILSLENWNNKEMLIQQLNKKDEV